MITITHEVLGGNDTSNHHFRQVDAPSVNPNRQGDPRDPRSGSIDANMGGPLGAPLLQKLADPTLGIILDSWLDADGNLRGDVADFIQNQ